MIYIDCNRGSGEGSPAASASAPPTVPAAILTTISVSIRQTAIQFAEMRKNIYPLNLYTQSILPLQLCPAAGMYPDVQLLGAPRYT